MTIGFIDNDILLKLVAFQLFDDAIASLGLLQKDLRVLPTAKYVFRRKRSQQFAYSDEIWRTAIAIVESCKTIPSPASPLSPDIAAEACQLDTLESIHEGEASLILSTCNVEAFLLISGDKNCIKGLSQLSTRSYQRLCGRVVCLEQIVLKLIGALGFEAVASRIYPFCHYDTSIQFCFGYSEPATESQVRDALQSCIREVNTAAPGLLVKL